MLTGNILCFTTEGDVVQLNFKGQVTDSLGEEGLKSELRMVGEDGVLRYLSGGMEETWSWMVPGKATCATECFLGAGN